MAPTISAVVIVVPQHEHFLPELVGEIDASVPAFDQVIIVASGFGLKRANVLAAAKSLQTTDVTVNFVPLGSAGANRNIGWRLAESELVCFLDADDSYAPERNAVIVSLFDSKPLDFMLHSYTDFPFDALRRPSYSSAVDLDNALVVTEADLKPRLPRFRNLELAGQTDSTNLEFRDSAREFPVHHAHITIRNSLRADVQFHEVFGIRNEDGVLSQDVLERGYHLALVQLVLSGYRQGRRAKPRFARGLKGKARSINSFFAHQIMRNVYRFPHEARTQAHE